MSNWDGYASTHNLCWRHPGKLCHVCGITGMRSVEFSHRFDPERSGMSKDVQTEHHVRICETCLRFAIEGMKRYTKVSKNV